MLAPEGGPWPRVRDPDRRDKSFFKNCSRLGLYTILLLPILYGVWHTKGRSRGGRILPNRRAIVLQQCEQCRRAGRMKGRLTSAQMTRSKTISCEGQLASVPEPRLVVTRAASDARLSNRRRRNLARFRGGEPDEPRKVPCSPLQDIAIVSIVWCME